MSLILRKLPLAVALLAACSLAQAKQTDAAQLDNTLTPNTRTCSAPASKRCSPATRTTACVYSPAIAVR